MDAHLDPVPDAKSKAPVVRGARACTVCRAAKMKCVGAEDGQRQCQRCRRANVECVFEKHRRGRKPGSKLSEASKMLRRLEKGLNSAKMKSQPTEGSPFQADDHRTSPQQSMPYPPNPPHSRPSYPQPQPSSSSYSAPERPPSPHAYPSYYQPSASYSSSVIEPRSLIRVEEEEDDEPDRNDEAFIPAKLIKQESIRNSFFRTILNPEEAPAPIPRRSESFTPPQIPSPLSATDLGDPITAGVITDLEAKTLFDAFFLRLNPFINLFDPALHTVPYVRSRSQFLFTAIIMGSCKFFKTSKYKYCQRLANAYANRAFIEDWKSIEVAQAYACMTYWKEPDDTRTWTFVGLACRMAVDLRLNRYVREPPAQETDFQRLERRNRERTYLVFFVHDRALSMQCNKQWMLPECDLVRSAEHWHEKSGPSRIRAEDVIVAAFVMLRRIAAETEDIFHASRHVGVHNNADVNYELVLTNCNNRLTQWDNHWQEEVKKANNNESFHHYFLIFFRLYVRIFLNSFAIQASMPSGSARSPNLYALSACTSSALECLRIASEEFREIHMLRYGQDAIATMTAYAALTLLKLLRDPHTKDHMAPVNDKQIHTLIMSSVAAYQDASTSSPQSQVTISATYHARFLRHLVVEDGKLHNTSDRDDDRMVVDSRSRGSPPPPHRHGPSHTYSYSYRRHGSPVTPAQPQALPGYSNDPHGRNTFIARSPGQAIHYPNNYVPSPQHATELDGHYWKNMFVQLGYGENSDMSMSNFATTPAMPSFMDQSDNSNLPHPSRSSLSHHSSESQGQLHYHSVRSPASPESFGH